MMPARMFLALAAGFTITEQVRTFLSVQLGATSLDTTMSLVTTTQVA
jgi:hypothetical protein